MPVVASLDLSGTAGVVAGIVALCAVAVKYLEGWQRYEARLDLVPMTGSGARGSPRGDRAGRPEAAAEPEPRSRSPP